MTLAAATLVLAASALPAFADNVTTDEGDAVVPGVTQVNLGDVCAGASASRTLGFNLVRTGGTNNNTWADGAEVTVIPASGSIATGRGTVSLGSLTKTLGSTWTTSGNNTSVDAGDATIGLAVAATAPLGAGSTGSVTYSATGASATGGTNTRTVRVAVNWNVVRCAPVDTTPPQVSYTLDSSAPTGSDGWYTGDVAIDWTVSDAESSATTTGCADSTLSTDGTRVYSCTATSAGGTTGPVQVTLKRDATAPTVSPLVTGELGEDGWYVGDVDVTWAISEDGSGVGSSVGCDPATLETDALARTYTCTVSDVAGHRTTQSVTVKRDATQPAIERTVSGTVGSNGWYTSDVQIGWSVEDFTSDVATTTGCAPVTVSVDTPGDSFTCAAVDRAGNEASDTVTIKRDATAPDITFTRTGEPGQNGWFIGPAALAWQVSDDTSGGVATDGCQARTVTDDTDADGAAFTCTAMDAAGNVGSATAVVRKDGTDPTVTHDVAGPRGDNGWHTGDATVTFSYDDVSSGVVTWQACDGGTVSEDTAGMEFTCAVTDEAGNTASDSVTVKRDATEPAIAKVVSGTEGSNGWYTGDVGIDWTVSDAMSGLAGTSGCTDVLVNADTAGTDYICSATDRAGNPATVTVRVKRDATAPKVTPVVTGLVGDDGWYVGDVLLRWEVAEHGSGVDTTNGCDEATLNEDTAGRTYTCTVSDNAGNLTTVSTTLKRDATKPLITLTVSGTEGANGWYTGDVSVDWTVSDATSDLATTTGCNDVVLDDDTSSTTYTCAARDKAGNQASDSVTLKRDTVAPIVGRQVAGPEGVDGWYVGDVSVRWTVSDELSGVAATDGCDEVIRREDTTGITYTCTVTDEAGNKASDSVTVKRDATRPVITRAVSGAQGADGWYTGDVLVDWTVSDATSGLSSTSGCDDVTRDQDTVGVTYTCTAKDAAGLESSDTVTVKRDATGPEVTLIGGPVSGAAYDFGDPIPTPTCTASDATSGVSPAGCTVTGGGAEVGSHAFTGSASDNAGNAGSASAGYTVRAWTLDGFYKPVTMGTSVVNTVKAGSTVPLKFNVYKGGTPLTTSAIGAVFSARKVTCNGAAIPDAVEEFSTTGQTSLRYDATAGQWIQNWATPSSGKNSCYRVTMTTADRSSISADFLLK
ncbi:hypothetical protein DDE18_02730 [Nocardioides gansuensis]|uniref:Ig-like domain-containing protein n=1 Tax=Nocardioides gansuensis TaxID=2138300 RepID=A0A2T8FFQ7_9ACTN|nr:hypothetical protein DDE18_02730 [Nocardioides gansuensis]